MAPASAGKRFDVVVTFQSRRSLRNATTSMAGVAAHVHRTFGLIPGFQASLTARQVHALARKAGLLRVEQDFKVHALDDPADNDFGTAAARSTFQTTGAGTEVCIIDTGVNPNHEQLDSKGTIPFHRLHPERTTWPRTTTTGTGRTWPRSRSVTEPVDPTPLRTTA